MTPKSNIEHELDDQIMEYQARRADICQEIAHLNKLYNELWGKEYTLHCRKAQLASGVGSTSIDECLDLPKNA